MDGGVLASPHWCSPTVLSHVPCYTGALWNLCSCPCPPPPFILFPSFCFLPACFSWDLSSHLLWCLPWLPWLSDIILLLKTSLQVKAKVLDRSQKALYTFPSGIIKSVPSNLLLPFAPGTWPLCCLWSYLAHFHLPWGSCTPSPFCWKVLPQIFTWIIAHCL